MDGTAGYPDELELSRRVLGMSEYRGTRILRALRKETTSGLGDAYALCHEGLEQAGHVLRVDIPGKGMQMLTEAAVKLREGMLPVLITVAGLDDFQHQVTEHDERRPPTIEVGPILIEALRTEERPKVVTRPGDVVDNVNEVEELPNRHRRSIAAATQGKGRY
jgi:hypothetical protein